MSKFDVLFAVLTVLVFGCSPAFAQGGKPQVEPAEKTSVGGKCLYRDYAGKAEIISVQEISSGSKADVRYHFVPDSEVEEPFAKPQGRIYEMTVNFALPSMDLVRKNDLGPGRTIDAVMKVIVQGTCTPVIFEFPELKK